MSSVRSLVRMLMDRLNPATLAAATGEKVIFYRHLAALGLPVPALHGVVGRAGGWSAASGRPVVGELGTTAFLAELRDDVVVKPSAGRHGLGVRVLRREGSALVDLDGRRRDAAGLAAELLRDPEFELFVVQERLHNHERVRSVCPVETLQTARMTTFASEAGRAQLVHAYLKIALRGGNVDTLHGEATGAVIAEIDLATGVLGPCIPHADHPGVKSEGTALPDWPSACELVRRASEILLPQRTIGWDVALTPEGPVLVEANARYDPVSSARFEAAMRAMERALTEGGQARVGAGA